MKNLNFYKILICFGVLWLTYSCEKADQTTTGIVANNEQLTSRVVSSCDNCPNDDDCCCAVWLQDIFNTAASLRFCGTTDGPNSCTGDAVGECPSLSNGGQDISLFPGIGNFRKLFCVAPGSTFWIRNIHPTDDAIIYLSCQYDITNPQVLTITIPAGYTFTYSTNGSCLLSRC